MANAWAGWLGGVGGKFLADQMGKNNNIDLQPDKTPEQIRAMKGISGVVDKYLPLWEPGKDYGGQFTAPMTRPEVKSTDLLNRYLDSSPTGDNYAAASRQLQDTLSGGYNPSTSPYYDSMKNASRVALQDQLDAARRDAGARGSYFTEGAQRDEQRLRSDSTNQLNQVLGQLYENERQRQFQGIGLGKELDAYNNLARTGQIQAGQQYGSLERTIQQADLESKYQDFLRKQQEFGRVPDIAQNLFGTSINYGLQSIPQQSSFQQILSALAPLAGTAIGAAVGGPAGAAVGGGVGGAFSQAAASPSVNWSNTSNPQNYGITRNYYGW